MDKTNQASAVANSEASSSFPVAFTLEAFQADVLEVFLFYVRTIAWIKDVDTAWKIAGLETAVCDMSELLSPTSKAADFGLAYHHISRTRFAKSLEGLYQFANFGRLDGNGEPMEDESIYTWISAIVQDARLGNVAIVWRDYGLDIPGKKCLAVAELANARNMLEGGEAFFNFFGGQTTKDDAFEAGTLTIPQMAMLAGMEEMSIRAAANPKRPYVLNTKKDGSTTRITVEAAKEWLIAKGRYVPIDRYRNEGEVNLAAGPFTDFDDFCKVLDARFNALMDREDEEDLRIHMNDLGIKFDVNPRGYRFLLLDEAHLEQAALIPELATVLELPVDLFELRCKQLLNRIEAIRLEKQSRVLCDANEQKTN